MDPALEAYCHDPNRRLELEAVLSKELKKEIEKFNYKLTNYRQLAAENRSGDNVLKLQNHNKETTFHE